MTKHYKMKRFDPAGAVACGVFKSKKIASTMDMAEVNCQRCQNKLNRGSVAPIANGNGKASAIANGKHNLEVLREMVVREYAEHGSTARFEALTAATAAYEIVTTTRAIVSKGQGETE